MMAPTYTREIAISAVAHDVSAMSRLEERLRGRLGGHLSREPVWKRDAAADEPLPETARVVVLLHCRLWGASSPTLDDALVIRRRLSNGDAEFLQVVCLDRSPLPSWLRRAPRCSLPDDGLAACVERILEAVAARGGSTYPAEVSAAAALAAADEERARRREAFLGSHRATSALGRELDSLALELARRATALGTIGDGVTGETKLAPGRCMLQLGPVALSLSWVRSHFDSVADGRLLVIEWEGKIGRGPRSGAVASARAVREEVLRVDATEPDDWRWRNEDAIECAYGSSDLAARCLDSLVHTLHECTH